MKKIKFGALQKKYQGKIFTIYERPVVLLDGSSGVFEYCARPGSVSVLAFNEKKELLLIKEYRSGSGKLEWFLPTGQLDSKEEKPRAAANRELREEAGFSAGKLRLLTKTSLSEKMLWDVYTFVATDLKISPLPADPGECIVQRTFFPLKKAVQMAVDGTIEDEFIAYYIIRFEYLSRTGNWQW